jgi:hypothetical protein
MVSPSGCKLLDSSTTSANYSSSSSPKANGTLSGYANISIPDSELGILILEHSLLTIQDTFVVGCRFSDKIIYPETFAGNPDSHDQIYSTENGIYQPHCGLDNVMLSWGHDEVGSYH